MNNFSIEIDLLNKQIDTPENKKRNIIAIILMMVFASAFILTRFQFITEKIYGESELLKTLFGILMMCALMFSGALILYYHFNKPKQGSLVLKENSITFKLKRQTEEILIENFKEIKFFTVDSEQHNPERLFKLTKNIDYGTTIYWIELDYKNKSILLQLDIQFLREKKLINEIIESWKEIGIKVHKTNTLPKRKL